MDSQKEELHQALAEHIFNQINIPISFRITPAVTPFIGRISELSEIQFAHLDEKMVVLSGPRGIGKSELARKYAESTKIDNRTSTLWIQAETHTTTIESFKNLALVIGFDIENRDAVTITEMVINHFKNRKSLFIFDNAETKNIFVNNLIVWTKGSAYISVIVTSRNITWDENKFHKITVKPFTKKESREFITTSISRVISIHVDDTSCDELANNLHFNPASLSDAVKQILQRNSLNPGRPFTVQDFIASYKPTIPPTVASIRTPTKSEIQDAISAQIQEELNRIGDQITDEAKRFGGRVGGEAERFGHRVRDEVSRIGDQISSWFR